MAKKAIFSIFLNIVTLEMFNFSPMVNLDYTLFINNAHFRLQIQRCLAFWPIFSFSVVQTVVYFKIFKNSYILSKFTKFYRYFIDFGDQSMLSHLLPYIGLYRYMYFLLTFFAHFQCTLNTLAMYFQFTVHVH